MRHGFLGRSGLKISKLCLGTVNFGLHTEEAEAHRIMDAALDAGINFFDTANHYPDFVQCGKTEEIIGRWFAQGGQRRDRVVLATKVYQPMMNPIDGPNDEPGISKHKVHRQVERSLRRLQTDHLDLYQMHHIDRRTTWAETWEAFDVLVYQGKIDYVGSSNFPGYQLALAQAAAEKRNSFGLVSEQHQYNLVCRLPELEVLPAAQALGIGVIAYSPLAHGLLSGRALSSEAGPRSVSTREQAEARRAQLEAFGKLGRDCGQSEATLAVAWLLAQPAISAVIIGPRTIDQLHSSLAAVELTLEEGVRQRLDEIFPGPGGPTPEAYAW